MNYNEILSNARKQFDGTCSVCKECNGVVCAGRTPGCGAKGTGKGFIDTYKYIQSIKIVMDNIFEQKPYDTSFEMFGEKFSAPFFVAPMAALKNHYNKDFDEEKYVQSIVEGTAAAGTMAFTGDGVDSWFYEMPLQYIRKNNGRGIPTIKPWSDEMFEQRLKKTEQMGAFAVATDIDAGGLIHLAKSGTPVFARSEQQLFELFAKTKLPFIVKGIMSAKNAVKAKNAGAKGIVVSNHGGRVLDCAEEPAKLLPEIRKAVGDDFVVIVDGAIRSGVDLFKVLALGADAALIGRPYATAYAGGGTDGVTLYTEKIKSELIETMAMAGATSLKDISIDMVKGY